MVGGTVVGGTLRVINTAFVNGLSIGFPYHFTLCNANLGFIVINKTLMQNNMRLFCFDIVNSKMLLNIFDHLNFDRTQLGRKCQHFCLCSRTHCSNISSS